MRPTVSEIENAFQPAKEADSAKRFAGRREAIVDAYYGLLAAGANIAIVGNRGIGKSSLARQIINISSGSNELLSKLNIPHDRKLDFLTVYLACGNTIKNTSELLERLLTSRTCLADWIYDIPKAANALKALGPKFGANIMGIEASLNLEQQIEKSSEYAISSHPIDVIFSNTASAIVEQKVSTDGVLIVIDEFDQIADTSGFASFLKSLATNVPKIKFCIVGVAHDIQMLMREHQSSDRLFAGSIISLPPMSDDELVEVIRIAENSINNCIRFDESAVKLMLMIAQGHPYMIHLVGKYALRTAFNNNKQQISEQDIHDAVKSIAERGADPVLDGRYKKAVASSEHREIVLKALAECMNTDGEVWTTDAYKLALDNGVDNASQYVGQLVIEDYGAEIVKVREKFYRFRDSLFATYVKARPKLINKENRYS